MKWKNGPNARLVTLIKKKTKMRRQDIVDVLMLMPECLAQSFFEENPAPGEVVNFGFIGMSWKPNALYGHMIHFKKTKPFGNALHHKIHSNDTELAKTIMEIKGELKAKKLDTPTDNQ